MVVTIDKDELFLLFKINSIGELEEIKYLLSPSIYEYHLNNLVKSNESIFLNKTMIEMSVFLLSFHFIFCSGIPSLFDIFLKDFSYFLLSSSS